MMSQSKRYMVLYRAYSHWLVWIDDNGKQELTKKRSEVVVGILQNRGRFSKSIPKVHVIPAPTSQIEIAA